MLQNGNSPISPLPLHTDTHTLHTTHSRTDTPRLRLTPTLTFLSYSIETLAISPDINMSIKILQMAVFRSI